MSDETDDDGYRPSVHPIRMVFALAVALILSGAAIYRWHSDGASAQSSARPSPANSHYDDPVTVTEVDDPCIARTRRNNIIRPCEDEHAEPVRWVSDPRMGIGGIALGMSLDEVIASVDRYALYPYTVEECISARGVRECNVQSNILPDASRSTFITMDGLDFSVLAAINRLDRVWEVSLHHVDDKTSVEECEAKFARLLDWATERYGPFAGRTADQSSLMERSRNGNNFWTTDSNDSRYFSGMRTIPVDRTNYDPAEPITRWDDEQYVAVSGFFVSQSCDISLRFSEPRSRQFRDES